MYCIRNFILGHLDSRKSTQRVLLATTCIALIYSGTQASMIAYLLILCLRYMYMLTFDWLTHFSTNHCLPACCRQRKFKIPQ